MKLFQMEVILEIQEIQRAFFFGNNFLLTPKEHLFKHHNRYIVIVKSSDVTLNS